MCEELTASVRERMRDLEQGNRELKSSDEIIVSISNGLKPGLIKLDQQKCTISIYN